MDNQTITQKFEQANNVYKLADIIYASIDNVVSELARQGVYVDNGIAVIPYEHINYNDEAQLKELSAWELDFVTRATKLAYLRWAIGEESWAKVEEVIRGLNG